jgi:hypothetical protein
MELLGLAQKQSEVNTFSNLSPHHAGFFSSQELFQKYISIKQKAAHQIFERIRSLRRLIAKS